jgi:RimK family alpha-L-glutamate ligase
MKILILTAEPTNFVPVELKKEAEALEHEVSIINPNDCYISVSDDPYISYKGTKLMDADIVIPRLSEDNFEYKLTIIKHLENMGMFVLNSAESMRLASDKLESQIIMNSNKFKTPKSAMMTNDSQLEYVAASLDDKFPMILKKVTGTHGIGVMKVDSMSSYKSVAQSLISDDVKFMVQEFIEHEQSARIITIGDKILVANLRGQPKAEGDGKEGKDFRTNSHLGSKTEQYEPPEHEVKMALELAALFGTRFCAVDYIPGKVPIILEVNGSPGLENIQKDYPDRNLAKEVIEYCIKNHKSEPDSVKPEEDEDDAGGVKPEDKDVVTIDTEKKDETDNVVGINSEIVIKRFNDSKSIEAKVDTGAGLCSIHGSDIDVGDNFVKFKYDGTTYKVSLDRTIWILSSDGGKIKRPIVKFNVKFNDVDYENVEFTIADREHMTYDVLIGRNLLRMSGAVVDSSDSDGETEEE